MVWANSDLVFRISKSTLCIQSFKKISLSFKKPIVIQFAILSLRMLFLFVAALKGKVSGNNLIRFHH